MGADDIVARLRKEGFVTHMAQLPRESKLLHAAADKIEQLQAENATLRRLLDQFVGDFKDEVQREAL